MRRLTILTIIFSLVLIATLSGCDMAKMSSGYCPAGLKVDGLRADEWDNLPTTYFEDFDVLVGLANDNQNLYLIFCFKDVAWARAVSIDGITLWLYNEDKKKHSFGIKYKGVPPVSELPKFNMWEGMGRGEIGNNEVMENTRDSMMKASIEEFSVEREDNSFDITKDGSQGPAVGFNRLKDIYTYEFSIPLREAELGWYGIGIKPGEELALRIEWGADREMKRPDIGGKGGMGGGRPGGGGGHGGMGGPPGGMEKPKWMEKQEIQMKILLATDSSSANDIAEVE